MADIAGLSVAINIDLNKFVGDMEVARKATEELTKGLQTSVGQLTSVSKSITEAGNAVANALNKSTQLVDKLKTTTSQMAKELATNVKNASQEFNKANAQSAQSVAKLAQAVNQANSAFQSVSQTITQSGQRVAQQAQVAATGVQNIGSSAQQAAEASRQSAQRIQQAFNQAGGATEQTSRRMEQSLEKALKGIQDSVTALQSSMATFTANMGQVKTTIESVTQAAQKKSGALVEVTKKQQDVVSGSANLGRWFRVLTTNILGVNAVAIALGTALGNLATQLVSRLVLAIIQSATQFSTLNNRLAESRATISNLTQEFQFITNQAREMGVGLNAMTDRWLQLAEGARNAGVDVEKVREAFARWNETVQAFRVDTLRSSWDRLTQGFGLFVTNVDSTIGVSDKLIWLINRLADAFFWLAEKIGDVPDPLTQLQIELRKAQEDLTKIWNRMQEIREEGSRVTAVDEQRTRLAREFIQLSSQEADAKEKVAAITQRIRDLQARLNEVTGEQRLEIERIIKNAQDQLQMETKIHGLRGAAQERLIKLLQVEQSLRAANLGLTEEQLKAEAARVMPDISRAVSARVGAAERDARRDFAAQQAQEILLQQTGLIQNAILTYEDYAKAAEDAEQRIRDAHAYSYEAELEITRLRIQEQRNFQNAMLDTAQMAGQALTALFPKSKAAAIAEAVINTAVGITKALRDVPFPLNWVQAGLIAATGAAQIAAIRSTNISGGGSVPRPGAGGGVSPAPQGGAAAPPGRAVQIVLRKGDFWSSEAVSELIDRINEEAQNGKIVLSTRTIPL